jgi:hypothetical protein
MCLIRNERNLLHSLFKPGYYIKKELPPFEKCPSKMALLAYTVECLDNKQLKLIESHLEKCDKCLIELIELQKKLPLPSEIELNMSVLKEKKKETIRKPKDVLDIVLKIKDNILELINHTGELIHLTPQLDTVRGKEHKQENAIVIRKDFKDKDISIEITLNRGLDRSGNNLKISLMKLSTEDFMSGIDVLISGMGRQLKEKTNEEGIVEFHGIKAGYHKIKVLYDIITSISIEE